jgi:hypothetical protein
LKSLEFSVYLILSAAPGIILGGKERPAHKADNLTAIYEPIIYKMWEPRRFTTLYASKTCYSDSFCLFMEWGGTYWTDLAQDKKQSGRFWML